jgi:hypothetical protein
MTVPTYHSTVGPQVIGLAAMAGLYLDPWQQLVIEHMFGRRADGSLSSDEVAVIVARQNGKGAIIEAASLGWLFLTDERLVVYTAHEVKTANETFLRIRDLIDGAPKLSRRCLVPKNSNGQQAIRTRSGQRLNFLARSSGSGRGFSAPRVILDEAMFLDERHMSALSPTQLAMKDPQTSYFSSAPRAEDATLNALCDRGAAGTSPRLSYFEWSPKPGRSLDDREAWSEALPAFGFRLTEEKVQGQRDKLTDASFAREVLGIREDPGAGGVIDEGTWARLTDPASVCGTSVAFAVDMPPARNHASILAVGARPDGLFHVEMIAQMQADEVAGWLSSPDRTVRPLVTVVDKASPAGSLIPDLETAGIEVWSPTLQQIAGGCGDFLDEVTRGGLKHLDDPALAAAAKGVTKRDVGDGGFAFARKSTAVDISPIVGATLALLGFKTKQSEVYDVTRSVW